MIVSDLILLPILLLLVAAPAFIVHLISRQRDRAYFMQRKLALCLLASGVLALWVASVMLLVSLCQLNGLGWRLGSEGLSVWFLFGGALCGGGSLALTKRFTLRRMLLVLGLVAFLASVPQWTVKDRGWVVHIRP